MCGRYRLARPDRIAEMRAALKDFEEFTQLKLLPRFNTAPSQYLPIIRMNTAGHPHLDYVQWGLIPHWTKGAPKVRPINAKAETIATSGMFRKAFERRRCLIPADGFYEPKGPSPKRGEPSREQYFFHRKDDAVFAFAGLWERWSPEPDVEPVDTFALITTSPNELVAPIHDRMPVILGPTDYERWLDRKVPGADVVDLLSRSATEGMERYRVDKTLLNTIDRRTRAPLDVPECSAAIDD